LLVGHLVDLQGIAALHNGSRAVEYGYNASVAYVINQLSENAPQLQVSQQYFPVSFVAYITPSQMYQDTPEVVVYNQTDDWLEFDGYAGFYNETNLVFLAAELGCNATDYTGIQPGNIALILRGSCTFRQKVLTATAAGASAALIYNDGADSGRMGPAFGSMGGTINIPAFGIGYDLGTTLGEIAVDKLPSFI